MIRPTDEQLVRAARGGDAAALDALLSRYKPLVKSKAAAYYLTGGDRDDLIQEGMIGLYKAFLDYAPEKNAVFSAFASLCISRQMLSAIKAAARQKHLPLNNSLSLHNLETDEGVGNAPNAAHDSLRSRENPESLLISRESSDDITLFIRENLSALEYDVLMLHMEGMSHAQIADALGKPLKSVDNSLQRVRRKVGRRITR